MVYAYYSKLNATEKRIYRESDAVTTVPVVGPEGYFADIDAVAGALCEEKRTQLQRALTALNDRLVQAFQIAPVTVRVLTKRPSKSWGELQGLYELADEDGPARITVWMRTAQRKKVVAFKTFLRTYLHELVHHLDYELLRLADSFHTEGFYKRESSLFKQLVPNPEAVEARAKGDPGCKTPAPKPTRKRSKTQKAKTQKKRSPRGGTQESGTKVRAPRGAKKSPLPKAPGSENEEPAKENGSALVQSVLPF